MQPIVKIVVAVLVVALIAVIGLIAISNNARVETLNVQATDAPTMEATAMPEATQQPETEHIEDTATDSVSNEAQTEDAQDEMYEGALAGMTDEEIAQQALAEEQNHGSETEGID